MDELHTYAPEDVILSNLEEASLRSLRAGEQELAHLRELAYELASEFTDSTSFLASLPEHRLPFPAAADGLLPNSGEILFPMLRELSTRHRILLCCELRRLIPATQSLWQEFFFPGSGEPDRASFNRISYQKNSYTDAAYQCFAQLLPEPRAAYTHSFPSVCEDVYNGLSEYCILPLENSAEGRLSSFSRLIAEYDMKIAAVCEVQVEQGRTTRFALLRRTVAPIRTHTELPRYFEFSCELRDYPGAEDVLQAARFCRLPLCRADLSETDSGAVTLHPVLETGQGDLPAFLLYLAMELPGSNPIGWYPNLSGNPNQTHA